MSLTPFAEGVREANLIVAGASYVYFWGSPFAGIDGRTAEVRTKRNSNLHQTSYRFIATDQLSELAKFPVSEGVNKVNITLHTLCWLSPLL